MKIIRLGEHDAFYRSGVFADQLRPGTEIIPSDFLGDKLQLWTADMMDTTTCNHPGAYFGGALVNGKELYFHEIYVED